jgi:hypothetical protein
MAMAVKTSLQQSIALMEAPESQRQAMDAMNAFMILGARLIRPKTKMTGGAWGAPPVELSRLFQVSGTGSKRSSPVPSLQTSVKPAPLSI